MNQLYLFISFVLISYVSFSQVLINEFEPNPVGADPSSVSIELKGTPNLEFTGYLLSIENDGPDGVIERSREVSGIFDTNGLLVVNVPDLENPSFTILLVDSFTGTVGVTDIDTNDDGIIDDSSSFNIVYDAIGIPDTKNDEQYLYGEGLGGKNFVYTGEEPFLVFRDKATSLLYAVNEPEDTVVHNTEGETIPIENFTGNPTIPSFGAPNAYHSSSLSTRSIHNDDFKIYPNPTTLDYISIESANSSNIQVEVYTIFGKLMQKNLISNKRLDVSNLNSGIYILKINQDQLTQNRKLVVK